MLAKLLLILNKNVSRLAIFVEMALSFVLILFIIVDIAPEFRPML